MQEIATRGPMADKVQQEDRARRLAEQMRANLRRRKAQGPEMKTADTPKDDDPS